MVDVAEYYVVIAASVDAVRDEVFVVIVWGKGGFYFTLAFSLSLPLVGFFLETVLFSFTFCHSCFFHDLCCCYCR